MRKPDEDERSEDGTASRSIGDGFGSVDQPADWNDGYGSDDDFYDEYGDSSDDSSDDHDDSYDDEDDDGVNADGEIVVEDLPLDEDVSEEEAEEVLEDILESSYGADADEVVEELEDAYDMSAVEILEEITGLDLGSDDDEESSGSSADLDVDNVDGVSALDVNPFDPTEMPTEDDLDLNHDGTVDHGDRDELQRTMDLDFDD